MASIQQTDMELQLNIFKLAKSFEELVKDMYNKSFNQTIISRKSELYSDYIRTNDGYLLLNNSSSILRAEIQKQSFTANVNTLVTEDTKKFTFNPFFNEFIVESNIPTNKQNEQLKQDIEKIQNDLQEAQNQVESLLKDINSTINDKDNLQSNYDQILEKMNEDFVSLEQKYNTSQQKLTELQNRLRNSISIDLLPPEVRKQFNQNNITETTSSNAS